ncbi:MAG: hypothetical protein ABIS00_13240 [Gemmatimonadales bacterium]
MTEHKVSFAGFLSTSDAAALRGALKSELGLTESQFASSLRALPDLDFYMMAAEHRQSWTPNDPVMVAAEMGHSPPTKAYDAQGQSIPLRLGERELPKTALLFLQAAEVKEELAVARVPGSRFIEANQEIRARRGGMIVANQQCNPETDPNQCVGGGDGGGGGGGCTSYHLKSIGTFGLIDNGNPYEGNEIEVHASAGPAYARVTGIDPWDSVTLDQEIICAYGTVTFSVIETDGWPNGDDVFALPFPNTSTWYSLPNGLSTFLYNWPNGLDPLYYDPIVSVRVDW